jgi:hypothetical protein
LPAWRRGERRLATRFGLKQTSPSSLLGGDGSHRREKKAPIYVCFRGSMQIAVDKKLAAIIAMPPAYPSKLHFRLRIEASSELHGQMKC